MKILFKGKSLILIALLIGVIAFAGMLVFIGQGNIRHVSIFLQERIEQTVAFEEVDGIVHLEGISGIGGDPNPYLVTRTHYAYILTVINDGNNPHRLYIEGLDAQTSLLEPGQKEILTIYPVKEGVYRYYDKNEDLLHLGFLEVITVIPSDDFTGIFRDLI